MYRRNSEASFKTYRVISPEKPIALATFDIFFSNNFLIYMTSVIQNVTDF